MRTRSGRVLRASRGTPTARGRGRGRGRGRARGVPLPFVPPLAPGAPGGPSGSSSAASGSDSDYSSDSSSDSGQGQPNPFALLPNPPGPVNPNPPPPLVTNPLFHPDPDSEDEMQVRTLPYFSGREKGAAGLAYLRAYQDTVGMGKWGSADEGLYRGLYIFASGGSAASTNAQGSTPFDLWCDKNVRPLARQIQDASSTCLDAAARQTVYNQFKPAYDGVFDLFKAEFCSPDVSEFKSLLAELVSVCQTHSNSAVWRPLQYVLMKMQGFYSRPVPSGVMSERDVVVQLLSLSDLLPETVSLRIKSVVDSLTQAQLPAAPVNPPAGWNPRFTLAAVVSAVAELAKQQDQAAGWGVLQGPSFPSTCVPTVVPSTHSVSATSSLLQPTDINQKAASMCAELSHMSAEGRCLVLAKVFPDALCPEHRMLHSLKDCPFAVSEGDKKARGVVKHVHATTLADEASLLSDGIVRRVTQELESVMDSKLSFMDSKLSVFPAGYRNGQGDYGRSSHGGGYGQSRPIGAGFQEGFSRGVSPHRNRHTPPVCNLCDQRGHSEDTCWIVFPHKCKDRRMLDELVVPDHLQGLFQQQLAKLRQAEAGHSHGMSEAPPGDLYPPRASAQHHNVHNNCVLTGLSQAISC